jgi:hypothetical protein
MSIDFQDGGWRVVNRGVDTRPISVIIVGVAVACATASRVASATLVPRGVKLRRVRIVLALDIGNEMRDLGAGRARRQLV